MYIKQTHSTSSLLREQYSDDMPHLYTIRTDFQTAGRGQAGNAWESEAGKNLLCSTLVRHHQVAASEQWRLCMQVAVALWDVLASYLPEEHLRIKWPNDIYYKDKKLVGILIENCLSGAWLSHSIVGVGVNVNQTCWRSQAPNPISMRQISGKEYDVEKIMQEWISSMKSGENRNTEDIKAAYMQRLYRRIGWHPYLLREVSTQPTAIAQEGADGIFLAEIVDISPQGELLLRHEDGKQVAYHFKQIRYVVKH